MIVMLGMEGWREMRNALSVIVLAFAMLASSCEEVGVREVDPPKPKEDKDSTTLDDGPIDFTKFTDTYATIASPDLVEQWAHYNVHDPSMVDARSYMLDAGDFYYCYSTDAAWGYPIKPGIQIRRSINLVEWEFVGWLFAGLPTAASNYIIQNGGTPNDGMWAPYAMKAGDEYRVYYSLASDASRVSAIGLAASTSPKGPFSDKGIVVRSMTSGVHTNAIDPSVATGKDGRMWMYYGSSWDGIYLLELDPITGLAKTNLDIGHRVAHRGFTDNTINGNIEGAEIIYNPDFDMYYLFIAYDWLFTKYNVRVGRSANPDGPFLDMNGNDMNVKSDNWPMIQAPYRFQGHDGWQGIAHSSVFERDGDFFIANQARPGISPFFMVMHVRQLHWTEEGWPMVSPERYADESESAVTKNELAGDWEQIVFGYDIVPGFADEQKAPGFQDAVDITINADGTIGEDATDTWSYVAPWLTMSWDDGARVDKLYVERGRDWENNVSATILFTGFTDTGTTVWGKKK